MNPLYPAVALRASHRCEYCHAPESIFNVAFEVEHITPESLDGSDDPSYLALSCRVCNLRKSAHVSAIDPHDGKEIPLFHPRRDRFEEHFQIDPDAGTMLGITASGRATIARLDMNSPAQITARLQWIRLGIYP
jgi:HNH endonuclease